MIKKSGAKKRFGQHFFTDVHLVDRIIEYADVTADDTVLEIGPGKGIMTGRLLEKTENVTAVELDRDLIGFLRKQFADRKNFRLIEGDILKVDLKTLFDDTERRIKVVSNIPYNISAPIIDLLIRNRELISTAVLTMQKEVAERMIAEPGSKDFGLMTLNLALCAHCKKVMNIKPGAFSPPPEVTSSLLIVNFDKRFRYPLANELFFRELTGAAFRKRRKMIRNSVIPYMVMKGLSDTEAKTILHDAGINPESRPETLDVSAFVVMSNLLDASLSDEGKRERSE